MNQLRQYLQQHNLTWQDARAAMQCSRSTVFEYLAGRPIPPHRWQLLLAGTQPSTPAQQVIKAAKAAQLRTGKRLFLTFDMGDKELFGVYSYETPESTKSSVVALSKDPQVLIKALEELKP